MAELPPLPEKFHSLRDHQKIAVEEVLDAFGKYRVVFLDAPTGSGKTLIGEVVRRELIARGEIRKMSYICHSLSLQDQFAEDFPYAQVLKGRGNYPTEFHEEQFPEISADDCGGRNGCLLCESSLTCPYDIAVQRVNGAALSVFNVSKFLFHSNYGRWKPDFVCVDECDVLEDAIMGFVEVKVSEYWQGRLRVEPLGKGVHVKTIVAWLLEVAGKLKDERGKDPKETRRITQLRGTIEACAATYDENWVRDYRTRWDRNTRQEVETGDVILKPIHVQGIARKVLWDQCGRKPGGGAGRGKVLCMSATIMDAGQLAYSLGLGDREWEVVRVPSTFPPENRPVYMSAVADMSYKTRDRDLPKLLTAIETVVENHPDDNILIHTAAHWLTKSVSEYLAGIGRKGGVHHYTAAKDRDRVLERFKRRGGVLVAASLDRGTDLPGDLCRVQIIAKTPFASLQDRQVSARTRLPRGDTWYKVNAARRVVQSTGRAVRSEHDHAVTYVFDRQMLRLYGSIKLAFPEWWREAVHIQPPRRFQ